MKQRLLHDCAWATAISIIEMFGPDSMGDDPETVFAEIYHRVKAGMEYLAIEQAREAAQPSTHQRINRRNRCSSYE